MLRLLGHRSPSLPFLAPLRVLLDRSQWPDRDIAPHCHAAVPRAANRPRSAWADSARAIRSAAAVVTARNRTSGRNRPRRAILSVPWPRRPVVADPLAPFSPAVRDWFGASFEAPTDAQARGWAAIASGQHTLIHAPTGSGKTLAAFLWCLDRLATRPEPRAAPARRPGTVRVLYVSPLKALTYDVERNLRAPLTGIGLAAAAPRRRAAAHHRRQPDRRHAGRGPPPDRPPPAGHPHHDARIAVPDAHQRRPARSSAASSTSSSTRSTRSPARSAAPTSPSASSASRRCGPAGDRGTPTPRRPCSGSACPPRNGRSRRSRGFLGGIGPDREVDHRRRRRAQAARPPGRRPGRRHGGDRRGPAARGAARRPGHRAATCGRASGRRSTRAILELIRSHRSTIVFTNSRRLSRAARPAAQRAGRRGARPGPPRQHRPRAAARRSRRSSRPAGCPRWSPRPASSSASTWAPSTSSSRSRARRASPAGLQRVGRAGHQVGAPEQGRHLPEVPRRPARVRGRHPPDARGRDRDDADPAQPARRPRPAARRDDRDGPLDGRRPARASSPARRPYETLTREVLEGVLGMLAGAYPSDEFAELKPRVVWDRVTDVVEGRRDARVVAVTSGGTIPDRGLFGVFMVGEAGTPGRRVGELDEEMVYELRAGMHGDVIVLGASSWRVEEIGHDRVTVSPAPGRARQAAVLEGRRGRPADRARPGDGRVRRRARGRPRPGREGPGRPRRPACARRTTSTSAPPTTCSPISTTSARRPAPCRPTSGSSSSASATSSATGGCAC